MIALGVKIFLKVERVVQITKNYENDENYHYDSNDFDGMGNQGRIPNKKPKNRAL